MSGQPSGWQDVWLRRLPNTGYFGRSSLYEVGIRSAQQPERRTITKVPYSILKPLIGWDEAALLERRARQVWNGGTGSWCQAYGHAVDPDSVDHEQEAAASGPFPRLRVRRLPGQGRRGRTRSYEVEYTRPDADTPAWVTRTSDPLQVILPFLGGWHRDARPLVDAADLGWDGGIGRWRPVGADDPPAAVEVTDPVALAQLRSRAKRYVNQSFRRSDFGALQGLCGVLKSSGASQWAERIDQVVRQWMVARTPEARRAIDQQVTAIVRELAGLAAPPMPQGSQLERIIFRLELDKLLAAAPHFGDRGHGSRFGRT